MNKNPSLHISNKNDNKSFENFFNKDLLENGETPEEMNNKILLGKKRRKFDYIYDYLLMMGLTHYGKRNIEIIQRLWLDSKSVPEIRHRIKNLTCYKAPHNIIKKYKYYSETALSKVYILFILGRICVIFKRNTMVWS